MEYSSNEIKVGGILIVGFGLFLIFLIVIFGVNWDDNTHEYQTSLKQVPGIVEGSLVKFGGMDVGVVTGVTLPATPQSGPLILLKLSVNDQTPVKVNSVAYVTTIGIMSETHIEISPGTLDAPRLPNGGALQSKEVLNFSQMAQPFTEMNQKLQVLIERLSGIFDEENRNNIASAVKSMDRLVTDGGSRLVELVENLDQLTNSMAQASAGLNELMAQNKDNFNETFANLETTTKETSELISDIRASLTQLESSIAANGGSMIDIMENFQYASQNLEEFTRIVKERPWLLVRKAAPPERKLP